METGHVPPHTRSMFWCESAASRTSRRSATGERPREGTTSMGIALEPLAKMGSPLTSK